MENHIPMYGTWECGLNIISSCYFAVPVQNVAEIVEAPVQNVAVQAEPVQGLTFAEAFAAMCSGEILQPF